MKSISKALLAVLLLPVLSFGQVFKAPEFSRQSDVILLAREIERHSPIMRQFHAAASIPTDMKPEEARALVNEKLNELNNDDLKNLYSKLDEEGSTQVGIALYALMNGLSNTEDDIPGVDYKSAFGGGVGVYLMWTLANIVLMPELAFLIRPLKQTFGNDEFKERYTYLTLAFTAMYMVRLAAINLLFGLSPNLGYALSGKFNNGDDWEDIDFDDNGIKRSNFALGIVAGLMLQNGMMFRLMYNLGLSKLYENADVRMYAIMLAVTIPIWRL